MREIKFRAWDKITKKYFYSGTLDNGDVLVIHLDGEIEISSDDTYKPEDFIIEQFTGLNDKSGREIYEGDIIRSKNFSASVVNYDETCAMFRVGDIGFIDVESIHHDNEWEYIGNIHENHELLGDK